MALTKSAKKAFRQSLTHKKRNIEKKDKIKGLLHEMKSLVSQKKVQDAQKLLPQIFKALDKAVKTGLIKKNAASRKKSRISKAFAKTKS